MLAAGYLLWLYQRTAFGEPNDEFGDVARHSTTASPTRSAPPPTTTSHDDHEVIQDVQSTEWIAWTPFLIAIVVFGVYPQLMFKIIDPAVSQLVETGRRRHPVIAARSSRPGVGLDPPDVDWHALAPELILVVGINLVLLIDLWLEDSKKWMMGTLARLRDARRVHPRRHARRRRRHARRRCSSTATSSTSTH